MVRFPLFALPFRAMTSTSQERMWRQQKNWGKPSGGTDYFVDVGSRREWQRLKHARMDSNANLERRATWWVKTRNLYCS
jgi:hypothetical protein